MGVQAVSTTGIYCRPECSARPNAENVSVFASPVAAEAAGYRSCLRCRPDRHVRSDALTTAPAAVVAAMALISDGYLDRFDEDVLADRVGYSTRQLRRLFEHHVGATPAFVARSRRAHFARRLFDESDLPMPVVARAAGFGSVRQMNRVVHGLFGFAPRDLRARRRVGDVLVADGGLRLRLPVIEPFDRVAARRHLGARVVAGMESLDGAIYRRTVAVCGNPGVVEIDLDGAQPHIELIAHLPTFDSIIDDVSRVRQMLGADDHVGPAERHLAEDPVLASVVESQPGVRVVGGWDRFETALRVVVGQQISVGGAATITARIVARHGTELPGTALGLDRVFPTADALADLQAEGLGMPRSRVETVRDLARAVVGGEVDLYGPDPVLLRKQLTEVRGIGPWTAEVITMRAWRDPDAFPAGDLGLRNAMARLLCRPDPVDTATMEQLADRWRPYRALAAQHLWTTLQTSPRPATMEKTR